ncbi:hypothetical protein NDU88_004197 [Pleurodeles waltl]|uniref:Peptidase A2 domain-containing protein n=1 Tax=Pleurodeles waltl TaxID=8319 RepID=A0AAV7RF25_PLEWA|nr:hypothetical protein NDU88_004197 [Pleurodeles waltl]
MEDHFVLSLKEKVSCTNKSDTEKTRKGINCTEIDKEPYIPPDCEIVIDGLNVKVLADSGSPYTILSDQFFNENWDDKKLEPNDVKVYGFGGKEIDMLGFFIADIKFLNRSIIGKVYVAIDGLHVIGWRHQKKMGMVLNPNAKNPVYLSDNIQSVQVLNTSSDKLELLLDKLKNLFSKELGTRNTRADCFSRLSGSKEMSTDSEVIEECVVASVRDAVLSISEVISEKEWVSAYDKD